MEITMRQRNHFNRLCRLLMTLAVILQSNARGQEPTPAPGNSYLAHLAAANSALRLNEAPEARRWLDEIPVAERDWEWNLLNSRVDSSVRQISTDNWAPVRMDVSIDGRLLAVATSDGFVRLYDIPSLSKISEWKVSEQAVYAARFHPNGQQIAVCARDGQLSVWDVASRTPIWTQKSGGEGLADVVYRPDGKQLLFCSWFRGTQTVLGAVSLWNSGSGEQLWKTEFGVKPIVCARFSPDGSSFAVGTWDALVGVWQTESKEDPRVFDFKDRAQYSAIDDIAFSPDGKRIAAATKNGTPRVWTLDGSAAPIDMIGHSNAVFSVAFSDDGDSLLTGGSDGVLAVWDISQRVQTHRFLGHTNRIGSIAIPPKGGLVLTASADKTIRAWDLSLPKGFESPDAGKYVYGMVVGSNGEMLVTGGQSETTISVWDSTSKDTIRNFPGTEGTINFLDGDGKSWVAGGNWAGDVCIWDITTGSVVRQMGSKELGGLQQCALSDDGKWVASATNRKQAVVWDAQTGEVTKVLPMPNGCWGIDFSNDSKSLMVGDGLGIFHWISVANWETEWICPVGTSQINTIRMAPTGAWMAVGTESGQLAIIDVKTKSVRHQVQAHSERIWSLDISPDEQRIATGSADTRVKTWDPITGKLFLTIADFPDAIYNVRFSPDGESLFINSLGAGIFRLAGSSR